MSDSCNLLPLQRLDSSSFVEFYSKALQECKVAGNTQLLLIPEKESAGKTTNQECMARRSTDNHPLKLQGILLVTLATKGLSDFETKQFVNNVAVEILNENETASWPTQLTWFVTVSTQLDEVAVFYFLNKIEDSAKLTEASTSYHGKALKQCNSTQ